MENNKNVTLIAGVINATGKNLFWKNEKRLDIDIGDYAVVENMKGYDLIKVIGKVETTESNASKFSNTKYSDMKQVTRVLVKELIKI